jgi:hypothetical protein
LDYEHHISTIAAHLDGRVGQIRQLGEICPITVCCVAFHGHAGCCYRICMMKLLADHSEVNGFEPFSLFEVTRFDQ